MLQHGKRAFAGLPLVTLVIMKAEMVVRNYIQAFFDRRQRNHRNHRDQRLVNDVDGSADDGGNNNNNSSSSNGNSNSNSNSNYDDDDDDNNSNNNIYVRGENGAESAQQRFNPKREGGNHFDSAGSPARAPHRGGCVDEQSKSN